jgi:tripartite ATP-independent transporter DctM subunit
MGTLSVTLLAFGALLVLVALRAPLALAMGIVGGAGVALLKGQTTFFYVIGNAPFDVLSNYSLSVLPMFILMGAFAVRTGLAADLVSFANGFVGHLRGGLAMAGVFACAIFGAVSGSNLATLSTMSKITVPEMMRRGYSPKLAAGTLASASTLDILIPPSIPMVIYATMTETSVGRLLVAGIVPGIILTVMFLAAIRIWLYLDPQIAPNVIAPMPFKERLRALRGIWGVLAVFTVMMVGMYLGYFSPTEAAAVGAFGILVVGMLERRLSLSDFIASVRESVHLSAVIFIILVGVGLFQFFMDSVGLKRAVEELLANSHLPAWGVMSMIVLGLVFLGCVMDATSILFITTPLLFPIVISLGYDSVWFGVIMVMLIQLGLIHPPFGLNVFIMSALIKEVKVSEAFWGCVPFVIANVILIVACLVFPQIILWLPQKMFN